jgi:undecaprenyl-diphosphatase
MDQALWKVVILGIIEGLTEFLPISSTGHLIVAGDLLNFADEHEVFSVVIQLGAILAVVAYFSRRFLALGAGLLRRDPAAWRFLLGLVVATLPAAVIGLLLDDWLDEHLMHTGVVAVTLAVGGLAILVIERGKRTAVESDAWSLSLRSAFLIGCCQLLALIPGVSRSGSTILGGVMLGVSRPAATEFSFFLAIPVMLGASMLKLVKHPQALTDNPMPIVVGFVISFVIALASIHWLLRYVARHDFRAFGWYRLGAGLVLAALVARKVVG